MSPTGMETATPGQVRQEILELGTSSLAFAALTAALELGLLEGLSTPQTAAEVGRRVSAPEVLVRSLLDILVAQGLIRAVATPGGPGFACPPGLGAITAGRVRQLLLGDLRSTVLQGADLVARARNGSVALDGWAYRDPEILQAQGQRSAEAVGKLATVLIPSLEGLDARLRAPGGSFLDVGTGVGAMAIEMCHQYPELRVVGLDPYDVALSLARGNVAAAGLEGRIDLRGHHVQDLDGDARFDLAWVPVMFMSRPVAAEGVARVLASLRPGGWALLSTVAVEGEGLQAAVARLIALLWGSPGLLPEHAAEILSAAGFSNVVALPAMPGVPIRLIVGRRPPA